MEFSKKSLDRLKTTHPNLQVVFNTAIKDSPLDFGISCGERTVQEQQKLYAQGRTTPGLVVTHKDGINKKSKHNHNPSLAVDIAVYVNGKLTWDESFYKIVAEHVLDVADKLNIKIIWGGEWKLLPDYPHFEIA